MKKLWLYSFRAYIRLGLFFYFKKIKVFNAENIPKDKPVLFLSNHQSALMDALLIVTECKRFTYFLTRAAVFNKPVVSKILKSFQMLPVYRIRDGWSNLSNNKSIFETCSNLLHDNNAVAIFPEGSHSLKRTLRPLSKGFTRIIFDTLEKYPDTDLQLVPIGLNFVDAETFADRCAIYFGKPIAAKHYVSENRNDAVVAIKRDVHDAISNLTTHIPSETYDEDLKKLEALNVDFLKPQDVNQCIVSGFKDCVSQKKKNKFPRLKSVLKGVLVLNLLLPYLIWKFVIQPKIDEVEFTSTFRFAIGITLVPVWLIVFVILFGLTFGWLVSLCYLIMVLCLTLLVVKA